MSATHQAGFLPWDRNGNRILLQSELGKSKPSTYMLPEQEHYYGKKIYEDPQKANQLMYKWKQHTKQGNPNIHKQKDFAETNRRCVKSLLHTSKDFSKFRKTSVQFKKVKEGQKFIPINLPQQHFAYGKPLDLEDPIKLVIAGDYAQTDRVARHSFYKTQTMKKAEQSQRKLSCYITKNHKLLKEAATKKLQKFDWTKSVPPLWKMNKFVKVQPKTNTKNETYQRLSLNRASSSIKN